MKLLIAWLVSAIAIIIAAYLLPGVQLTGFGSALIAAIIIGLINALLRPLFILFTLPLNILTLGLFTLVINAVLILLASNITPGFEVNGFWWALLFSIILTFVNTILSSFVKKHD